MSFSIRHRGSAAYWRESHGWQPHTTTALVIISRTRPVASWDTVVSGFSFRCQCLSRWELGSVSLLRQSPDPCVATLLSWHKQISSACWSSIVMDGYSRRLTWASSIIVFDGWWQGYFRWLCRKTSINCGNTTGLKYNTDCSVYTVFTRCSIVWAFSCHDIVKTWSF